MKVSEEVHHFNEDKADNCPGNLVICKRAYHKLLHIRQNAMNDCGNPDWRRCAHCRRHDDPINLRSDKHRFFHQACRNAYLTANRLAKCGAA